MRSSNTVRWPWVPLVGLVALLAPVHAADAAPTNAGAVLVSVPSEPRAVAVTPGSSSLVLSWTRPAASNGASIRDYVIEYRVAGDLGWTPFTDPVSTSRSRRVTGLAHGTTYELRVAAVNAAGTGPWSVSAVATAGAPRAPARPGTTALDAALSVWWSAPASSNGSAVVDYVVQYRAADVCCEWTVVPDGISTARSLTIPDLTPGVPYVVQVAAVNARGQSPFSATSARTTPARPFTLTPIVAEAGYFVAEGECPSGTSYLSYRWTNASSGTGWGNITHRQGTFSLPLRMLASGPGETIEVTVRCMSPTGRTRKLVGTVAVASGIDLLPLPEGSGSGRRIVYSLSAQQIWVVDMVTSGGPDAPVAVETVVKTHLVSGRRLSLAGGKSQLGTFRIFAKRSAGCNGGCPKWLSFHRGYAGIIGLHQIPLTSQGPYQRDSELGQPRSHGCVRQSKADAQWLYSWAVVGDVVVVVP